MAGDQQTTEGQSSSQSSNGQSQATAGAAQAGASSQTQTQTQNSGQQASQAAAPTRPEGLPDRFWDAQNGVKVGDWLKEHNDLTAFKAAEDSRRLTLPQKPDDYKIGLPQDFKVPEGVEFKFDEKSDVWKGVRDWAHKSGLDQSQFENALSLYAGIQLQGMQQMKAARDGEIAKLGASGPARVDAVVTWLNGVLGESGANAVKPMMVTAGIVEAFESIIKKFVSGGAANFSQQHRDTGNSTPTDEQWAKMSYHDRLEYVDRAKAANGARN